MSPRKVGALLGVLVLLLAACGQAATAIPTVSETRPTATPVRATLVPTATRAPGTVPAATPTPAPSSKPAAGVPKRGGVFRTYIPWDQRYWDVQTPPSEDWALHYTQTATFSRLMQYEHASAGSCENPLGLVLAESYRFLDDRTIEVKLRPGVRFHNKPPVNGREVTADDVVFSYLRAKQIARAGLIAPYLKIMDKVEATAPLTVRFHFSEPFAHAVQMLLAGIMVAFVLPPEAGGPGLDKDYSDPNKSWIGTGPYLFKEWQPGVKVTFTRNPNYFKPGVPYLDGVDTLVVPDSATQLAAFLSGKLDALLRVSPTVVDTFRKTQPNVVVNGCPFIAGFGTVWIRTDKAPWNDARVRRALNMAVDRQAMVNTLFLGEGEILTLVPSHYGDYSLAPKDLPPEIRRYVEYRPEEAKKLLAEAGFPNGFTTTFEATRAFGSPFNESMEAMLAMWAKVGVKVEPKWYERAKAFETINVGDYDNLGWTRAGEVGNPFRLPSLHSTSDFSANRSHVNDPELDKLIDKFIVAFDVNEQVALVREIQKRVVDQAYVIQQPTPLEYAALHPYVKGFGLMSHMSRSATIYDRMWFEK